MIVMCCLSPAAQGCSGQLSASLEPAVLPAVLLAVLLAVLAVLAVLAALLIIGTPNAVPKHNRVGCQII